MGRASKNTGNPTGRQMGGHGSPKSVHAALGGLSAIPTTSWERQGTIQMPNEKEIVPPDPQADAEREERIRERAYQLWEEDGAPDGRAEEYWHRARQLV